MILSNNTLYVKKSSTFDILNDLDGNLVYYGDDEFTIVDGKVSQTSDESGQGNHSTQDDPDDRPTVGEISGEDSLTFDGVNDYEKLPITLQSEIRNSGLILGALVDFVDGQPGETEFITSSVQTSNMHNLNFSINATGNIVVSLRIGDARAKFVSTIALDDGDIDPIGVVAWFDYAGSNYIKCDLIQNDTIINLVGQDIEVEEGGVTANWDGRMTDIDIEDFTSAVTLYSGARNRDNVDTFHITGELASRVIIDSGTEKDKNRIGLMYRRKLN